MFCFSSLNVYCWACDVDRLAHSKPTINVQYMHDYNNETIKNDLGPLHCYGRFHNKFLLILFPFRSQSYCFDSVQLSLLVVVCNRVAVVVVVVVVVIRLLLLFFSSFFSPCHGKNIHNKYIKIPCNLASIFYIDFEKSTIRSNNITIAASTAKLTHNNSNRELRGGKKSTSKLLKYILV